MFHKKQRQLDVLHTYQEALMEKGAVPRQTLRTPTRPPTFVSDYVVPVAHALTWGLVIATLGILLFNALGEPKTSLWTLWAIYFLVTVIVAYLFTSAAVWRLLWMALENTLGRDLDNSGGIGDRPIIKGMRSGASSHDITGRIAKALAEDDDLEDDEDDAVDGPPDAGRIAIDFPIQAKETTLQWFVRVSGRPEIGTNMRLWEPILGRRRYQQWRDSLIDSGWARWNAYDPDNGKPLIRTGWIYDKPIDEVIKHIS